MKAPDRILIFVFIVFSLFFLNGCKQGQDNKTNTTEEKVLTFINEKYGFSFSYAGEWEEVRRDLPGRWALLDKKRNTILFLVNSAKTSDLLTLGRSQALRDLYDKDMISELNKDDVQKIFEIVKLESFNNKEWYTYGIKFSDKNVNSLVSGTLCGDNEIMIIMVSDYLSFESIKLEYESILNTFKC